uniref:Uncharacterized protein n=1 Tax=Trichogramma kaykai TaxID=54128 RepID=A0ABD2WVF7_9HYME
MKNEGGQKTEFIGCDVLIVEIENCSSHPCVFKFLIQISKYLSRILMTQRESLTLNRPEVLPTAPIRSCIRMENRKGRERERIGEMSRSSWSRQ